MSDLFVLVFGKAGSKMMSPLSLQAQGRWCACERSNLAYALSVMRGIARSTCTH